MVMVSQLCSLPFPGTGKYVPLKRKRKAAALIKLIRCQMQDILDYLSGANIFTRVLVNRGRKTSREEINKDKENLNNTINQLVDLTGIYKTHHPPQKNKPHHPMTEKYTFFSCAQRIFILQDIP